MIKMVAIRILFFEIFFFTFQKIPGLKNIICLANTRLHPNNNVLYSFLALLFNMQEALLKYRLVEICTSTFPLVATENNGMWWWPGYIWLYRKDLAAISYIEHKKCEGVTDMNEKHLSREMTLFMGTWEKIKNIKLLNNFLINWMQNTVNWTIVVLIIFVS